MVAMIHVIGDNDYDNENRSLGCEISNGSSGIHSVSSSVASLMCFQCWWQIETLIACGGLSKNSVFIQEHADITGKSSV